MRHMKKLSKIAALLLVLLLMAAIVPVARGIELPAPTGQHSIGQAAFHWTDTSRPETMTDSPADYREVIVYLWYPAEGTSGGSKAAYFPNVDGLQEIFTPVELLGVRSVRTRATANAPVSVAQSTYPVILLSHGNSANSAFHTAQIEELVSHGYIVAAIDHPYDALGVVLFDGQVARFAEERWPRPEVPGGNQGSERYEDFYKERVETRAKDAVYVLDRLAELNTEAGGRFNGRLDLERVGMFGHSVGGVAAGRACQLDERFKACLNLDGLAAGQPFYLDESGNGPSQPYMVMLKSFPAPSDEQLAEWKMTRAAWLAIQEERLDGYLDRVEGGSYKVTASGFTHQSFTDNPLMYPSLPESLSTMSLKAGAANQRQVQLTREYILAFFDKHIQGKGSALLDQPSTSYPEIALETYGGQEMQ